MAVVSRDYDAFKAKLQELLPDNWWWRLYGDRLRHAWDHTIPPATQPEARGVEDCQHCVNGIVPMTMNRPCSHCNPALATDVRKEKK